VNDRPVVRGPEALREIVWQPARYHAVLSVLKNPVYAGAYAYGRSKTVVRLEDGQKQVRRQVQRRREDWAALILDHHEGYIGWDVYQSNQTMIAHNDNARGNAVRGSIKHGEALLAGLLRCGHCGAKLLAQYPGPRVIRYQCSGYLLRCNRWRRSASKRPLRRLSLCKGPATSGFSRRPWHWSTRAMK
jgi:Recombinase/Recombinase zinc beta ribbon domain